MAYVIVVTALLSAAAFVAEQALRVGRNQTRWIWLTAVVASLFLPVVVSSVAIQVPSIVSPTRVDRVIPLSSVTSATLSPLRWMEGRTVTLVPSPALDPLIRQSWLVASLLLLAALVVCALHLVWRRRQWRTATLDGADLYVSRDIGPAVVGLLRPRIVVPEWLLDAPALRRAMVVAHERAHLDAGDQRLLTVTLGLLVLMPWNLPLWWQLRRLRHAIEIDCDARVLRSGYSRLEYGETLLAVGERRSAFIGPVAAMVEPVSFLERRIRIMTLTPARWRRLAAVALGALSLGIFTVAAQVSPPNAGGTAGNPAETTLSTTVLDRYVGDYQLGPSAVMSVTRKDQQLYAQLTGQPAVEIYPSSATNFFYKVVNANIDFVVDAQGPATALVLHQNGANMNAPRVDTATAHRINADLAARVQTQAAAPGSEAALRKLIAGILGGAPNYDDMSPALANATRQQLPTMQSWLQPLGAVQSVEFRGVGNQGEDVYAVHQEKGVTVWRIVLGSDGKIMGALAQPGP
jgi:beta-lactamase regulating signal transducer with metallopeptidase domain